MGRVREVDDDVGRGDGRERGTGDLEALAAWLKECGVTTVAMESTGVYWIPLYDLLASRGFEVMLVDPRQTKHAPGRPKSDVLDCQWIRRLHSYGLLTASFRPADEIVRWRGFQRQREMLIRYAAQHVQHLQKMLEEMNVKLTEVVSDIVGQTGMKIIKDIVGGERDPLKLAKHRHPSCKTSDEEIARALHGNWRPEQLFALKQALKLYEFYQKQLRECEAQIEVCLRGLADKSQGAPLPALPANRRSHKPEKNEVRFGARALLFRMAGVDLTQLEGISETTALVILSEIGTDLSALPDGEELRELAGAVSAASRQRRQDLQASDPPWGQPRGAGVADGGAGLSSREECAGSVLPPHSVAGRRREGGGGDGAEDRGARVSDAEVRPGVRASKRGGVRVGVSRSPGEVDGEEGGESGLQAGAEPGGSGEFVRMAFACRPPTTLRV